MVDGLVARRRKRALCAAAQIAEWRDALDDDGARDARVLLLLRGGGGWLWWRPQRGAAAGPLARILTERAGLSMRF